MGPPGYSRSAKDRRPQHDRKRVSRSPKFFSRDLAAHPMIRYHEGEEAVRYPEHTSLPPTHSVTDYRHCVETQDHHLEGSKMALMPPYILIADQYCLQITVPISATYYPIMSYYLHLLRVYIEALELYSQSSRSCNSSHCKAYTFATPHITTVEGGNFGQHQATGPVK